MSGSFVMTAVWGAAILVAFVGWGGALGSLMFGGRAVDAGLRATWGMSLALLIGGITSTFGIASSVPFPFVVLGTLLAAVFWYRARGEYRADLHDYARRWKNYPGTSLLVVLCAAAIALQYLASIWNVDFNPNDDLIAYFPFAKQILQQGTLFDPFSTRRAMSLGGQSFLHALVLAGAPGFRLHLFDQGICLVIAAMLVTGARRPDEPRWGTLLALVVLATMPDIRANTYPQTSGIVLFFGLYRTMRWLHDEGTARPIANATIVSLIATAACTLRSNYIAVAVPMVGFSLLILAWSHRKELRPCLVESLWTAGFGFAFLLPWMVLSYHSSGTPLFPLIAGNFNAAFPMLQAPDNWGQQISDFFGTVRENRLLQSFPLLFLAGLVLPEKSSRKPLLALHLAILTGWLLLVHTLASDIPSFARYVQGFMIAGAVAVLGSLPAAASTTRMWAVRTAQVIGVAAALMQLWAVGPAAIEDHAQLVAKLRLAAPIAIHAPEQSRAAREYSALQSLVPRSEPLLVMVDYPFMLDFKRNPIYNADTAAAISPPPHWPYFHGPEAVAGYLRGQSIRYLAYVKPDRALSLFNRGVWERQHRGQHPLWRAQAPYYLDIFDNLEALSRTRRHLFEGDTLVLLDLMQPTAISSAATSPLQE